MTYPIDYESTPPLGFENRKTGLTVYGVILLVMGCLAGCGALLMPLLLVLPQASGQGMRVGTMVYVVLLYASIATAFIWTGIGSILAKRWTRPLILCASTIVLVVGIITMVTLAVRLPRMAEAMKAVQPAGSTTMPAYAVTFGVAVAIGTTFIMYLVIPMAFLVFYRSDHVRATLEYYDPHPRWTDGLPLPVLGISMVLVLVGASFFMNAFQGILPSFGMLLMGIPATAVQMAVSMVVLIVALAVYRRRMAGWGMAVVLVLLGAVSMIVTTIRLDPQEVAAAAAMTDEQARVIMAVGDTNPLVSVVGTSIWALAALAYLFWARKFFTASPAATSNTR